MMFQTNAPALLELRWAFSKTVTAPNNGESKSTYQYPPSKSYGSKNELGLVGSHFTAHVETVCLLSKLHSAHHIRVAMDLDGT